MKILLLSDSHGHTDRLLSVLDRHKDIDYAIHLGDFGTDAAAIHEAYPCLTVEAVQGKF